MSRIASHARAPFAALLAAVLLASCAHAPVAHAPAAPPATSPAAPPVTPPPAPSPAAAPAATPLHLDGEPAFEIGLTTNADTLRLECTDGTELRWRSPGGEEQRARIDEPLRIRASGAQMLVEPLGRPRAVPLAVLQSSDTLWFGGEELAEGREAKLLWNGKHWRGRFKVFLSPRGGLTLATRVGLERYLQGVVPGEIGALKDSLLEAGRAQAIAARSYSLFYRGRRGSEGFDLYASVEDQLYSPLEAERPLATRCVDSTRGMTALYGGLPIRANYCSTCGGITAEAWEAWPTEPRAYLRAVADRGASAVDHCAASPQYRWREEWSAAEFAQTLAKFAPAQGIALPAAGVGEVRDVVVEARSHSGRVWSLAVVTSTGTLRIPAYSLRQVLRRPRGNGAILRSNLFKIAAVRDARGTASRIVVSGAGSGHGVGLCQTGALAMAREGSTADGILAHYYPGAALTRLY